MKMISAQTEGEGDIAKNLIISHAHVNPLTPSTATWDVQVSVCALSFMSKMIFISSIDNKVKVKNG